MRCGREKVEHHSGEHSQPQNLTCVSHHSYLLEIPTVHTPHCGGGNRVGCTVRGGSGIADSALVPADLIHWEQPLLTGLALLLDVVVLGGRSGRGSFSGSLSGNLRGSLSRSLSGNIVEASVEASVATFVEASVEGSVATSVQASVVASVATSVEASVAASVATSMETSVAASVETSVAADVVKAVETGADVVKAAVSGADSLALTPAALDLGSVKQASKADSTDDNDVWS